MNKFEQLGLSESLLKAILDLDLKIRPKYRRKRFPIIGKDTDMVALAQTGQETAAFGFPVIQKIDATTEIHKH
jgi:ATP-dependent RNA helicase DeaD